MSKIPDSIKVVLADDHGLFREGFRFMIKKQPDIDLVAEAENGEDLLKLVEYWNPDAVITDIKMPKMDGIEVMHIIKRDHPFLPVIALTNYEEESLIIEMIKSGAKGYLLKSANNEEIIEAIKTVVRDKTYYCSFTREKVNRIISKEWFRPNSHAKVKFNTRELRVINLICDELTNKEIADHLFISKRTVETYRENILLKMGVKNTAGVVVYAIKHGLYKI